MGDRSARRWILRLLSLGMLSCMLLSSRSAPGTVSEQRARLPAAAECGDDPVVGHWRAHQHYPKDRDWTEFTLIIRRLAGKKNELVGTIYNHSWVGGPEREQAGECDAEQRYRLRVKMEAKGKIDKDVVTFEGTEWKIDEIICGSKPLGWYYNLDRFTGKIDTEREEFQSVNNDGGRMVNHPTVFRRVKCLDDDKPSAKVKVKPPPIFPESKSGCGCSVVGG